MNLYEILPRNVSPIDWDVINLPSVQNRNRDIANSLQRYIDNMQPIPATEGYLMERFIDQEAASEFQCHVCLSVCVKPITHVMSSTDNVCVKNFCYSCLYNWIAISKNLLCMICKQQVTFGERGSVLVTLPKDRLDRYNGLLIKCCFENCKRVTNLDIIHTHEQNCAHRFVDASIQVTESDLLKEIIVANDQLYEEDADELSVIYSRNTNQLINHHLTSQIVVNQLGNDGSSNLGTDFSSSTYQAEHSELNELRSQLAAARQEIADLRNNQETLRAEIESLRTDHTNLQQIQAENEELRTQLNHPVNVVNVNCNSIPAVSNHIRVNAPHSRITAHVHVNGRELIISNITIDTPVAELRQRIRRITGSDPGTLMYLRHIPLQDELRLRQHSLGARPFHCVAIGNREIENGRALLVHIAGPGPLI